MKTTVTKNGIDFEFSFDEGRDDPEEGPTLTGVYQGSKRLRPSKFTDEEIPYQEAAKSLGLE